MKLILEFKEFKDRESRTRTKTISKEEFLKILKKECKNFSFDNDQLYRGVSGFGKYGLFFEKERKGTIGNYSYKDFFELRKDYPVPRYKSLIGSTSLKGANTFSIYGSFGNESQSCLYLVIPFDDIEIIFAGSPDLAIWAKLGQTFTDDLFILEKYSKDFKIPLSELEKIRDNSKLATYKSRLIDYGFEFFTNGNCLLLNVAEIDWLKSELNKVNESKKLLFDGSPETSTIETHQKYIDYSDIGDIMFEITDEFPELEWYVWNSNHSSKTKGDDKSFVIELVKSKRDFETLYYLEPKIWKLIQNVSSKLESHGLYVSSSDFGETDSQYELVISEIGHKPVEYPIY